LPSPAFAGRGAKQSIVYEFTSQEVKSLRLIMVKVRGTSGEDMENIGVAMEQLLGN